MAIAGGLYLAVGLWEYWLAGMYRLIVLGLLTVALAELALWQHRRKGAGPADAAGDAGALP